MVTNIYPNRSKNKKRGLLFWIIFWTVSVLFLAGWFVFWKVKHQGYLSLIGYTQPLVNVLPLQERTKEELNVIFQIIPKIARGDEKSFLVLFQNNNELRPGGGYIGTFGILKIKGEEVTFVDTHDTNIFDSGTKTGIQPPYPMGQLLKISDWELRDSNWSANFPTNALKAEEFYHLEGGQEKIEGVVAVSTSVLETFLQVTGPVEVAGYPGEYTSENAISKLQYQVEKGYVDQNIDEGNRKDIMKELSKTIVAKAQNSSFNEKKMLAEKIQQHLEQKDIMIYFHDKQLQDQMERLGWSGEIKPSASDYLMMVDANLASLKSDQVISRTFDYTVDFSVERPRVDLEITYQHNGRVRDWLISDYTSFLRVYVPQGSWLIDATDDEDLVFGNEQGKKYFGTIIRVPLGKTITTKFSYYLPNTVSYDDYKLLIQKQSGVERVKGNVKIISPEGKGKGYEVELRKDWEI